MRFAMTTAQANERFMCGECRSGGYCGCNCVEDGTCSVLCLHCKNRVWFAGSLEPRQHLKFVCPYCHTYCHKENSVGNSKLGAWEVKEKEDT